MSSAASASSEMKDEVSCTFLSSILIRGSRYVSMHRLRYSNISLMVIRAIFEREDLRLSASLDSCLISECKVAPEWSTRS